jgi:signal transduction histidine kinase
VSSTSTATARPSHSLSTAPLAVRYGVAVLIASLALALTLSMAPLLQRTIFVWFFGAVIIAARWCGFGPALLTALIGIIGVDYYVIPPAGSFKLEQGDIVGTLVFAVLCFVISTVTEQMREARAVAERHAADAERNAERNRLLATEAQQANEAKQQFLAAMSHELRTPLNAIGGYAELLEMGIHGDVADQQREPIARIRRSQRHLQTLVEQILSFAKTEAGKRELVSTVVPVDAVLAQSAEMIAPQVSAAGQTLAVEGCDDDLYIRGDRDAVEQILINLLGNAVKYTPSGGRIGLTCVADARDVGIRVSDTGPGIPPDKRDAIFQPFTQLDQELSSRKAGVGLGLAISRDLARAMQGDVTVDASVSSGATFVLRLPRA